MTTSFRRSVCNQLIPASRGGPACLLGTAVEAVKEFVDGWRSRGGLELRGERGCFFGAWSDIDSRCYKKNGKKESHGRKKLLF